MLSNIGLLSYLVSSAGYFVLAILLLVSWRGRIEGGILLAAVLTQIIWSGLVAFNAHADYFSTYGIFALEIVKFFAWTLFMLRLLNSGRVQRVPLYICYAYYLLTALSLFAAIFLQEFLKSLLHEYDMHLLVWILLAFSILGLLLIEQIYRNLQPEKRWAVKFFCIGLGALFAYDLYLYSEALLFDEIDQTLWDARGVINLLSIPLIAISAKRNPKWSFDIFISRHVVFYSTGILAVGAYLVLVSIAGYYLKIYGNTLGAFTQTVFLVGAVLVLFVVMSSGATRSKLKVFLSKHFYKNKYDYRDEWLRLIHNISEYKSARYFKDNIIQTVACILQCRGGVLFLKEADLFQCVSSWNCPAPEQKIALSSPLIKFMNKYEWIIDVNEYKTKQDLHAGLVVPDWILDIPSVWLIVPLKHNYEVIGFFILLESGVNLRTNWEDRDLLKAVGRQVSSYLAFIQASEALTQAEQFAAFNRLSAYVVHDLKNSVSQLELIVKNAEEHQNNPDFITDSFLTVSNVVGRMQKMLSQLKKMRFAETDTRMVNVKDILTSVVANRSVQLPVPDLQAEDKKLKIYVEPERFSNIMEHLIQNAQEATGEGGYVNIVLTSEDDSVVIKVEDNGCGMTSDFIRERLFRPFDTTKGNAGMGIGVFEVKEFMKFNGGEMTVESNINVGTVFELKLPLRYENNFNE